MATTKGSQPCPHPTDNDHAVRMVIILGFLFGAFIGSFLNVCIHRLPRNESIITPPSRCYACGTRVQWRDNLPILGYLILHGRCRWCDTPFSPRYLIMEIAVGVITATVVALAFHGSLPDHENWWWARWPWLLFPREGMPDHGLDFWYPTALIASALATASMLAVVYVMVVAVMTDLDHMIIPDEITLGFQVVAPYLAAFGGSNLLGLDWTTLPLLVNFRPGADGHGHIVYTSTPFLGFVLLCVGVAVALLSLSLRWMREVYSRLPDGEKWHEQDYAHVRKATWWFLATLVLPLLLMAGLALGGNHFQGTTVVAGPTRLSPTTVEVAWPFLVVPYASAPAGLAQAILGALVGWILPWGVGLIGTRFFGKGAMGFGDVKLLAAIGCFLGPIGVIYGFFAGTMIGAVLSIPIYLWNNKLRVPFGPYLAAGCAVVLLFGAAFDRVVGLILNLGS